MAEDVMSSPSAMMERMMRKVGRNFPYENKVCLKDMDQLKQVEGIFVTRFKNFKI
jgi:hypothetical protein